MRIEVYFIDNKYDIHIHIKLLFILQQSFGHKLLHQLRLDSVDDFTDLFKHIDFHKIDHQRLAEPVSVENTSLNLNVKKYGIEPHFRQQIALKFKNEYCYELTKRLHFEPNRSDQCLSNRLRLHVGRV